MRCLQSPRPRPPTNPGPGTCRRPAPPVVRRVLPRIVGGPRQRPTATPAPCLYPTCGLRRLSAPILYGGPQIPREVPSQKHPPRPRRPPSLPHLLVPALSRSRLLAGMKTTAQSSRETVQFGTRRAIAFQNRRTRRGRDNGRQWKAPRRARPKVAPKNLSGRMLRCSAVTAFDHAEAKLCPN